jgi:hypothetical protein
MRVLPAQICTLEIVVVVVVGKDSFKRVRTKDKSKRPPAPQSGPHVYVGEV